MSTGAAIDDVALVDAHASSRLSAYLRGLWERRGYMWYVARSELRQRQVMTVFGSAWHLLNPVLSIAVYYVIFGKILQTDRGVDNFLLFLAVGLFTFQFTQKAVTRGANSIVSNRGLVQSIRFPRAMLPISATLTEALATIPTFFVIYGVALIMGQEPLATWALLPLLALWQVVFNLGASMVAARMTTHFRDMQQLLPFIFRLLIYASGVIFAVEEYVTERGLELFFVLNPMYGFITIARWAVMGRPVSGDVVLAIAVWPVIMILFGFFWFRAAEDQYDHV